MKKILTVLFVILGLIPCNAQSGSKVRKESVPQIEQSKEPEINKFPEATGFVSDFENVFTQEERRKLEGILDAYQLRTGRIIVVITVNSIEPYSDIKDFAIELSNEWGIGDKDRNDGLSIVFSKALRQVRISTGLGTEKILTDDVCQNIIDTIMLPQFKEGNYYEGMYKGLKAIAESWEKL